MSTSAELRCYHCGVSPAVQEMLDGWCEKCGKRLPDSFKGEAKKRLAAAPAPAVPHSRRALWIGLAVVLSLGAAVALAASR